MSKCKHCAMGDHNWDYCCDGAHIDLLEKEVAALRAEAVKFEGIVKIAIESSDKIQWGKVDKKFIAVNSIFEFLKMNLDLKECLK